MLIGTNLTGTLWETLSSQLFPEGRKDILVIQTEIPVCRQVRLTQKTIFTTYASDISKTLEPSGTDMRMCDFLFFDFDGKSVGSLSNDLSRMHHQGAKQSGTAITFPILKLTGDWKPVVEVCGRSLIASSPGHNVEVESRGIVSVSGIFDEGVIKVVAGERQFPGASLSKDNEYHLIHIGDSPMIMALVNDNMRITGRGVLLLARSNEELYRKCSSFPFERLEVLNSRAISLNAWATLVAAAIALIGPWALARWQG